MEFRFSVVLPVNKTLTVYYFNLKFLFYALVEFCFSNSTNGRIKIISPQNTIYIKLNT
jgi:hypothetical protein